MILQFVNDITSKCRIIHNSQKCRAQFDIRDIFYNVTADTSMDIFDSSRISPIRDINIFRKPLDIHKYCTNYYNSIFIYCHIFQLPFYRFLIWISGIATLS